MGDIGAIRPLLVSVDGDDPVRVALEWERELYVGEAPGPSSGDAGDRRHERVVAAGGATLQALDQLTPSAVTFALEWAAVVHTAAELPDLVVAMPRVEVAGVPMRYAGAVVDDGDDPALLAARATLDALNRRLGVTGL
ncbi:hypothetical protein ER308_01005 [Egibacter rhizosphaerae]|uniref:Uncharacterized protein n=1 Tax=Egibacter rhizosphaerae TaxID=1670831 RepID=A0A411YAT6_9ACTN|nr:hypothetical protein [Egibacter rhizosphaerae]QBI18288.1 hypothetical protein ER308_01005 [Egibacter rhizosphaerae]